jgi:hypothetical protein
VYAARLGLIVRSPVELEILGPRARDHWLAHRNSSHSMRCREILNRRAERLKPYPNSTQRVGEIAGDPNCTGQEQGRLDDAEPLGLRRDSPNRVTEGRPAQRAAPEIEPELMQVAGVLPYIKPTLQPSLFAIDRLTGIGEFWKP